MKKLLFFHTPFLSDLFTDAFFIFCPVPIVVFNKILFYSNKYFLQNSSEVKYLNWFLYCCLTVEPLFLYAVITCEYRF